MLELTTGVMFLMSSIYGSGHSDNHIDTINAQAGPGQEIAVEIGSMKTTVDIEEYLHAEYFDAPILVEIARCESELRQFDKNGKLIRGRVNADDVGIMQINEFYHADTAKNMGIDLHTLEGNTEFGRYLYEKYGTSPWSASKPCWSKSQFADIAKK